VIRLGLTGSIASGKSTVLAAFAALDIPVFSSDEAVHALYEGEAKPVVERLFPGVTIHGHVDRAALSRALLAAPERLKELEAAVHPLVRKRLAAFFAEAEKSGAAIAVADVPLLFETGFDYGLDAVVVTHAPDQVLRERALRRPGMSVEKLDAILARQLSQAEKLRRADYVIETDVDLAETQAAAAALIETLKAGTGKR
jgi:dephospho-CoA kinase